MTFHVGRFEDVELPDGGFGAVFSATAFHSGDPAVGWSKAARVLRPGGILALLAYIGGRSELDAGFLAAWREVLPEAARWSSRDERTLWEGAEARRGNVSELWAWLAQRELATAEAAELFGDARGSRRSGSSETRRRSTCSPSSARRRPTSGSTPPGGEPSRRA